MTSVQPEAQPEALNTTETADQLFAQLDAPETSLQEKNIIKMKLIMQYLETVPAETLNAWVADPDTSWIVLLRLPARNISTQTFNNLLARAIAILQRKEGVTDDDKQNAARIINNIAVNPNAAQETLERIATFATTDATRQIFFPYLAANPALPDQLQTAIYEYAITLATQDGAHRLMEILSRNPNLETDIANKMLGYQEDRFHAVARRYPHAINRASPDAVTSVARSVARNNNRYLYVDMLLKAIESEEGRKKIGSAWLKEIKTWASQTLRSIEQNSNLQFQFGLDMHYICKCISELLAKYDIVVTVAKTRSNAENAMIPPSSQDRDSDDDDDDDDLFAHSW